MSAPTQEKASLSEEKKNAAATSGYPAVALAAQKIFQEKNLTRTISIICDEICRLFQPDALLIQRIDAATGARTALANRNLPAEYLKIIINDTNSGIIRTALFEDRLGRLEVIQEPVDSERMIDPVEMRKLGVRTLAVLPFHLYGDSYGGFSIFHFSPREYSAEEVECLEALAAMSSVALQKVYLLEESESGRAVLTASQRIAKIGSYEWNASLRQLQWSDETFRIFGREPGEFTPVFEEFLEAIHPEDKEKFLEVNRAAEKDCRPFEIEFRILRPDGTERVVLDHSDPIFGEGGEVIGWRGAVQDITERRAAEREAESRLKRLEIVGNIARAAGAAQYPEELFAQIIREIKKVIPCERCVISNWEQRRGGINRWHVESDIEVRLYTEEEDRDSGNWIGSNVYQAGRAANIPDLSRISFLWANRLLEVGIRSVLYFPVMLGGRYVAHLSFNSTRLAAFTTDHEALLADIAVHLGPAIKNAMLYREAEERSARKAVLNELSLKISGNLNPGEVLNDIARATAELTGGGRSRILLYEEATESFKAVATWGDLSSDEARTFKPGSGLPGVAVKTGEPQIIKDLQSDPRVLNPEWVRENNLQSCITFPILLDRRAIVITSFSEKKNFFDKSAVEIMRELAPHAAIALENAALHGQIRDRAERLELVGRIARVISSELEPEALFESIAGEIRRVVTCHRFALASFDVEKRVYPYFYEDADTPLGIPTSQEFADRLLIDEIYESKRPLYVPNLQENPERGKRHLEKGYRSVLTIPISTEGGMVAHMVLASKETDAFSPTDEELLVTLAPQLGTAIKNALLYREAEARAARLEFSGEIARAVGSSLKPDEVFEAIVSQIQRVLPCERCVVGMVDQKTFRNNLWSYGSTAEMKTFKAVDSGTLWWYEPVYKEKRVVVISDFRERPGARAREFVKAGLLSGMIVPILQGDECIAHLSLSGAGVNGFTERDESLVSSIALHLGPAIRNATLYRESEERSAHLELVNEIARAVGSELEPGELFRVIVDQIRKVIPCNRCIISSFRPETFEQRVWRMESDIEVEGNPKSDLRTARYYQRVYVEHLPFNEPDIREFFTSRAQLMAAAGFRSNIVVPILRDGECVAHVGIMSTEVGAFSLNDEALLLSIASHLGTAIRNATLYRESEARAARFETAAEIARVVGSELEPEDLFRTITEEMRKAVPCDLCAISTIDFENDRYRILYVDGVSDVIGNLKPEISERSWVVEAYETKRPVIVRDYREIDSHNARAMAEAGYLSALIIPIVQEDFCIAHMALIRREADAFTTDEEKLLESLSGHLGMAIRNASLFRESEDRAQRMAAFNDLSRKISENLNLEEVLESVGRAAESLLEADSVGIILIDDNSGGLIPHVLLGEVAKQKDVLDRFREGGGAAGYIVRSGESVVIPDVLEWPEFQMKEWARETGLFSYAAVPLREGAKVMGVIFCLARGRGAFSDADEQILRSLSDQAVIAIENARLHEEAQRSRVFFESVVDDNADAIHVADIEGNVIYWNRGAEKLFGYSNEEALGRHFSDLLIPEAQRERWLRSVSDRVTERGVAFHTETQRMRKDGSMVSVSLTLSPVKDVEGNLIAISAIHKDLTGRKHAEEALLERENRLRTILDTAVDGIITIDERGIVDSINPSAQKLLGYTSAEVVGQNVSMLMSEPFHGEHDSYLNNYLETGITGIIGNQREVPALRKDGSTIPVDLAVSEIWLGKRRLFNGVLRDLTERKRTEKEREEYVERLMTLNHLTQKVGTSLDLDEALEAILESTVQLLNVPYVGVFTRQGEIFALRAFRGRFHTESSNRFYRVGEGGVGMTVEKGFSLFIENVPEDPNWKMHKASWDYGIRTFLGVPLKSEGEVIGVLSCLATEPRIYTKGEYELINAFANMAAITIRNAANHSQLKETVEELRRSQEMIIRAEKLSSLGVLAAGAAHEILNPASVILMRAEMIGEDAHEDSFENKSAEIIVRNVRRIRSICDDLRRFSRDEVPAMEPFDPDEALRFSLELIKHELAPVGIELDLNVNEIPSIALGDASQIQQVFVNLISNARDAMPDGGTLSIRSGRCDYAGKGFWEVHVSDTGVGIPEDVLPQIFDPFFTTKPADQGTGLGLSVLHGIVKSHEGEVSVESQPGKGTTFTVRFPEALKEIGV